MKKNFRALLKYFLVYFILIVYWELITRLTLGGFETQNFYFLFFVPAEALFFATFSGFTEKTVNRVINVIIPTILCVFYVAQVVYYNNFGSLFSVSMIGMGTQAIGNFWWALKDTLKASVGVISLLVFPVFLYGGLSVVNKPKQEKMKLWFHAVTLVLTVALWFGGILGIKLMGTGRMSAYSVFQNSLSDTDTTASRFGALTTTLLEGGAYYLGLGNDGKDADIGAVNDITTPVVIPDLSQTKTSAEEIGIGEGTEEFSEPRVKEIKYFVNDAIDFEALKNTTDDPELIAMCNYFVNKQGTSENEYTGLFEGYNLIYICAESFWTYACNETITPTLYKLANNGIVLNNYYNSYKNTTTNGEYAFATSMWADVSRNAKNGKEVGSFPQSSTRYMPQGLGKLFKNVGATAYAFHNYKGTYYRRSSSWPNLGYDCYFRNSGMKFTTAWPASDLEMMQQSVDKYINDDQFHAYYMTFSGHGPYSEENCIYVKNIDKVRALAGENTKLNEKALGYLACNYELDQALEYLLNRLEEAGKLENTVIVINGDHYPYYINDNATRKSLMGHKPDENFELYKSTCVIYCAGLKENIVSDTYCCTVDILPTILNLFNIPFESRLMVGTDIFSDGPHKAVLYNKNFLTEYVKYNASSGKAEWTELGETLDDATKEAYLDSMIATVDAETSVSIRILKDDFFKFVWKNSGLMSAEEEAYEEERIKGLSIDDIYDDDEPED